MAELIEYFENDDPLLKMQFEVDGVAQTPDSGNIVILTSDGTEIEAETPVTVVDNVMEFQTTNLAASDFQYLAYFTGTFSTEQITKILRFRVRKKDGLEI